MYKLIIREISYYQVFKYLCTEIFHDQSLFLWIHFAIQHKGIKYLPIFEMQFLEICIVYIKFLLTYLKQTFFTDTLSFQVTSFDIISILNQYQINIEMISLFFNIL